MQTTIVVDVNAARRIAPDHDVFAEPAQPNRLIVDEIGAADGIPHVAHAEFQFVVEIDRGLSRQWNTRPPSAMISCPVMNDASSDNRKETAPTISDGEPSRGIARFVMFHSRFARGTPAVASLLRRPGATQLMRTPSGPSSRAMARVNASTAPLDVK